MIETETEDEKEINNILEEVIKIINKIEPDATIE